MNDSIRKILSTFDINGTVLRNRLAVAPMTRVTATEDGLATPAMHEYYLRFARGGFGLIVTEGLYTDQAFSQGYLHQPGIANDAQAQAWVRTTTALQAQGAKVIAQLMHAGALSQGNRFRAHAVAPSAIQPKGQQMAFYRGEGRYPMPQEITEGQIQEVIEGFAAAAVRAVQVAGFDGVEIHAANGYLLDQFLTAETNQRVDRWGGSVSARLALTLEILQAVKRAVGNDVPVGLRISQGKVNDFTSKWAGQESDAQAIFGALASAGADFIHVTEFEAWRPAFEAGEHSLLALARRFAPEVAIIANGSLHGEDRAAQALDLGADLVALGRGALANPDLPRLLRGGQPLRAFDSSILGPIADIKQAELDFEQAGC